MFFFLGGGAGLYSKNLPKKTLTVAILAQVTPVAKIAVIFLTGASSESVRLIPSMAEEIVRQWRQFNQVEHDMDFAFLFDTFAEASAEAGSEVAGAWRRLCMLHGYFNIPFTEQTPASCRNLNQNSPGLGPGTPQE